MKKFVFGVFVGAVLVSVVLISRHDDAETGKPKEVQIVPKKKESEEVLWPKPQILAPIFTKVRTPYDQYLVHTVGKVLGKLNAKPLATKEQALRYLKKANGFRYKFTDPYMPMMPEVIGAKGAGDCKDKSLWLAERINDPNIQFVIGHCHPKSRISHAWLLWQCEGNWWILDCTNKDYIIRADNIKDGYYVPKYSYSSDGAGSMIASQYQY